MPSKSKIKASIDPQEIEKQNKAKNFLFKFDDFELQSDFNQGIIFNNRYKNLTHFLKIISDLMESLKILSQHCFNNTLINGDLEKSMHLKKLENEEAINRITNIMQTIYHKNIVDQYSEGSMFIEFGRIDDCRYIGVLLDYHIINLLYIDPHHLTFKNDKFPINQKMSYTFPSLLSSSSINSSTKTLGMNIDNVYANEIDAKYMEQKEKDELEFYWELQKDLYDEKLLPEKVIDCLKSMEGEKRNEK